MIPRFQIPFILTLCYALLPFSVQAISIALPDPEPPLTKMPSTKVVAKYYRIGANVIGAPPQKGEDADYVWLPDAETWLDVSKADGDAILTCLLDSDKFKTWESTWPPGIALKVAPDPLAFQAVHTNGLACTVQFSYDGRFVTYPKKGRLVVPEKEQKILAQIFAGWLEADRKRIASQPLPCQFIFGSLPGVNSLSGIARLFYGDASKWPKIYEANKAIIKNPDIIEQGMRITIPKLEP